MRTTLSIDDHLLTEAKKRAAAMHRTLSETIDDALRFAFASRSPARQDKAKPLPASGSGGLQPGVDLDDTSALMDRMDGRS